MLQPSLERTRGVLAAEVEQHLRGGDEERGVASSRCRRSAGSGGTHFNRATDGKQFTHAELDIGVRGVLAKGADVWACGSGLLRSSDGGQRFNPIALPAGAAKLLIGFAGGLFGIAEDGDGSIWTGGA
ncbi:MAG: hypothetical protein IT380_02370 [Myxococcales bacterium]|nr:hypothetical protein [Myxococcales bacterium]